LFEKTFSGSVYLVKPVAKNAILHVVGNAAHLRSVDDERRRLIAENERYQEELEVRIAERTGELSKALVELQEFQAEIIRHERLNALSQLAAGICHDFNNVLMPILGLTGELVEHPEILEDREETLSLLKVILSASEDARSIVQRMREFYRPRDGMEMELVTVDALLHDVVELTRPRWEAQAQSEGRIIQVMCEAAQVREIVGNASQLREALTNLVLNASDAMSTGGTIRISATQEGATINLNVTDTGGGMPEAVCKRCLEPFFSTKGEHGTGLGLAMVHGIVKRHNGTVEIESELSKGTTVRIRLPLAEVAVTRSTADQTEAAAGGLLSVLVVDDEEWSRSLIARYLQDAGHGVELAENGTSGLKIASGKAFDMVITDRAMPDMSGDQLAMALKKRFPELPVLLLTGSILRPGEHTPAEVDAVLEKPVTQRELIEVVNRLAIAAGRKV